METLWVEPKEQRGADGQQQSAKDLRAEIWNWLAETESGFKDLGAIEEIPDDGVRFYRAPDLSEHFSSEPPSCSSVSGDHLELIAVERTFGTEELSSHSECLTDLEEGPSIFICRTDAEKLNLAEGDVVSIELNQETIEGKLQVADHMAAGTLVIPRHKDLDWQKMGTGETWIGRDQIRKLKD